MGCGHLRGILCLCLLRKAVTAARQGEKQPVDLRHLWELQPFTEAAPALKGHHVPSLQLIRDDPSQQSCRGGPWLRSLLTAVPFISWFGLSCTPAGQASPAVHMLYWILCQEDRVFNVVTKHPLGSRSLGQVSGLPPLPPGPASLSGNLEGIDPVIDP